MNESLLNWICYGVVFIAWMIGAFYNRLKVSVKRGPRRFTLIWFLVGITGTIAGVYTHRWWEFLAYHARWMNAAGAVLLVSSTLFTLWSRFVLGRMWAADAEIKEGHRLRMDGPYRITRHPIYTGMLGMLLGSAMMNGFGWLLLALIAVFLVFLSKIRAEEVLLIETFGDEYRDYQRRIPRLFPTLRSLG